MGRHAAECVADYVPEREGVVQTLSLVMIVRNEERRIREAIQDMRQYATEIVVVDQSSDDRTASIAGELADTVKHQGVERVVLVVF